MKTNPHFADAVYKQVGEEIARKDFSLSAMTRAVAESNGNKALIESLYAKFRVEERLRELERETVVETAKKNAETAKQKREAEYQATLIKQEQQKGIYTCLNCGYHGVLKKKRRGSILFMFLLSLACLIPGVIYAFIMDGYKGVCPKCKTIVTKKM